MKSRVIFSTRYTRSISKAKANVGYIGFRSREKDEQTKGFFDEVHNLGADYHKYIEKLENTPALKHPKSVKVHTMVFSLRQKDYDMLKLCGGDLRDVARDAMKDLAERKGLKLTWIGALHEKAGHPHVHVSVLAVGEDTDGKNHRLKIDKDDVKWMREKSLEHLHTRAPIIQFTEGVVDSLHLTRKGAYMLDQMSKAEERTKHIRHRPRRYKSRIQQQQQNAQHDRGVTPEL